MRFISFALLASIACQFPRPPHLSSDAGIVPDSSTDAASAAAIDAGLSPRCANVGYSLLPWPITGATPHAVASADLNGDSTPDLVVVNKDDSTVSVLLGNGNGTFQAKVDYRTGTDPRALAIADVNGDARPDLVVGNFGDFSTAAVSVLLGNGNGTFGSKLDYTTSPSSRAIAIADVSGDGKPDIVVAATAISVLLNNGNGTFAPKVDYSPGSLSPRAIAIGDMNGDGKRDLVLAAANDNGNGVLVLLGSGTGTFATHQDFLLSGAFSLNAIALADMNGDGKLDATTGNTRDNIVTVLLGNGGGSFTSTIDSPAASKPLTIVAADVNGDNKSDLVVGTTSLSVMIGNGNGRFAEGVLYPIDGSSSISPESIVAVDINRDGKIDLAAAGHDNLNILIGNGDGTFAVNSRIPGGLGSRNVATADVNRDGKPDVILTNNGSTSVGVLSGAGDGTFAPRVDYDIGSTPSSVVISDVNHDGNPDLIATSNKKAVSVLLGNSEGAFTKSVDYSTGMQPAISIITADANNDSKLDIVALKVIEPDVEGNPSPGSASVMIGNGDGTFANGVDYPVGPVPASIAADDLNRDGNTDLVVASTGDFKVTVLLGDGSGRFTNTVSYSLPNAISVAVADVNEDVKSDLIIQTAGGTAIWAGNGDGTFAARLDSLIPLSPRVIPDAVGDSSLDLVATDRSGRTVSVLAGNGDGTFQNRVTYPVGSGPASAAVADLNRDSQPDLIVNNSLDNTLSVLLGTCVP